MKYRSHKFGVLLGGALCLAFPLAKAGVIPEGFSVNRYTSLWMRSPFTTASVQQDGPQAGFAEKLVLVGIVSIGTKDRVTLYNKDSQERIILDEGSSPQGLKLVSVDADPDPWKTTVTIQKGTEIARVRFEKTQLATNPVSPLIAPNMPGLPPPVATQPGTNPANPSNPPIPSRQVFRAPPIPTLNSPQFTAPPPPVQIPSRNSGSQPGASPQ